MISSSIMAFEIGVLISALAFELMAEARDEAKVLAAVAAGAIFIMLIDTIIPEAFEEIHNWSGSIAAVGFLFAFTMSTLF